MKIKKNVAISETGFVFDPATGDSYSLNPMGLEIIDMIRKGKTQEAITASILSEYEIDADSFERYFVDFVSALRQLHILEDE